MYGLSVTASAPKRSKALDRVHRGGAADVAALGVQDHRDARVRVVDVRDQPAQRVLRAESGEVGDLRLERAGELGGGIDDVAAELKIASSRPANIGGNFAGSGSRPTQTSEFDAASARAVVR